MHLVLKEVLNCSDICRLCFLLLSFRKSALWFFFLLSWAYTIWFDCTISSYQHLCSAKTRTVGYKFNGLLHVFYYCIVLVNLKRIVQRSFNQIVMYSNPECKALYTWAWRKKNWPAFSPCVCRTCMLESQ